MSTRLKGCYVTIESPGSQRTFFYAELWRRPYQGEKLAQTCTWYRTARGARDAARRIFNVKLDRNGKVIG